MKKYVAAVVAVVFLALSIMCVPVYADDNVIEKTADWWATRGKQEPEKSMILAQRRTERAAKKADKEMKKAAKSMQKDMKKAWGK
jgi:hypothetical protein